MSRFLHSVIVAACVASAGCALTARSARISELQQNPARYQDHAVHINGIVTNSWGTPFVPIRFYRVSDGTGELTVVSQGGRTPTKGARVDVKGRVEEFAVLGGQPVGLHLREEDLDVKRR
jgi:hypothetical protein